jgi:hypothetical protein
MVPETLDARLGASVSIDYCPACQAFWFDGHESLQLTPGSTLKLFTIVGEQTGASRPFRLVGTSCPRCTSHLVLTHDLQRSTRFEYWRCPQGDGRLISFYDFLREKDFLHPLSPQQIAELKDAVQSVNCSNCGAPVDLTTGSICAHCGTPLTMLDLKHPERLIAELRQADRQQEPRGTEEPEDATGTSAAETGPDDTR